MFRGIAHPRYWLFLAVYVAAVFTLSLAFRWEVALIAGFDLAVLTFCLSCWRLWVDGKAEIMRAHAIRDDAGQFLLLILSGLISVVVLIALSILMAEKASLHAILIALLVGTLVSCWVFTNLIFAFHYARLYYSSEPMGDYQGLDFPSANERANEPDFSDFVNFAFVIGMACQTADIAITKSGMRRVSTFHGLFAFAFNLGILALSVNVMAGFGAG